MDRIYITVRPVPKGEWEKGGFNWKLLRSDQPGDILTWHLTSAEAIEQGRIVGRRLASQGLDAELMVYRRDGKLRKGRSARSSYGSDPRRSKG